MIALDTHHHSNPLNSNQYAPVVIDFFADVSADLLICCLAASGQGTGGNAIAAYRASAADGKHTGCSRGGGSEARC
jgi:hypothetical protein